MKKKLVSLILILALYSCRHSKVLKEPTEFTYDGEAFTKNVRSTEPLSPEEERLKLHLPPGFKIELFASEPMIGKPMNMSFDAAGRLWVTQSYDYPYPAESGTGSDRITILEDSDHNGRADKATVFIDSLTIPIGIIPVKGGAIAYSVPSIFHFNDSDNNGVADKEDKLIGPFGFKDTHGMVNNFARGYDGWIYACHGFSNYSAVAGKDGDTVKMESGNTFRFKPDGSAVEQTTYGRVNPFGLVFDELGYLYSTDCHSSPLYQLISGADYPHFGKVKEGIGFAPVMKAHEKESTALSGIEYYTGSRFPAEYRNNFYIGDVVTSRVYRNSFIFQGSTPVAKKEADFIRSEDPWFRPVSIKLGPDGALYVADFYNRIIGHYEVPLEHPGRDKVRGRIWRITYEGQDEKFADLSTAPLDELLKSLNNDNITTSMTAANQITDRVGLEAVESLNGILKNEQNLSRKQVHALWILFQLNMLKDDLLHNALTYPDESVRVHAIRILDEKKDTSAAFLEKLINNLNDKSAHVQRASVEALRRYPSISTIRNLLDLKVAIPEKDSHLRYTTRLCLRNLLRDKKLASQLNKVAWNRKESEGLADVLIGVHSPEASAFLTGYLQKDSSLKLERLPEVIQYVARYSAESSLEGIINLAREKTKDSLDYEQQTYNAVLQALKQRQFAEPAKLKNWGADLASRILNKYYRSIEGKDVKVKGFRREEIAAQRTAFEVAGKYKIFELEPLIRTSLALDIPNHVIRSSAIRALMQLRPEHHESFIKEILLDTATDIEVKRQAADVLGEFDNPVARELLEGMIDTSSTLQLRVALALSNTTKGKELLFRKASQNQIDRRLLTHTRVKQRLMLNISASEQTMFNELVKHVIVNDSLKNGMIQQRLNRFMPSNKLLARGKQVFIQNCSMCHQAEGQGGLIGPQLTGIGNWGSYALTEKIIDPNRNISQAFVNYTIKTKDGKFHTGLLRREEGSLRVFASISGEEFSIPKIEIEEQKASEFTLMPDTFGTTLSTEDFNALLSYLLSLK